MFSAKTKSHEVHEVHEVHEKHTYRMPILWSTDNLMLRSPETTPMTIHKCPT